MPRVSRSALVRSIDANMNGAGFQRDPRERKAIKSDLARLELGTLRELDVIARRYVSDSKTIQGAIALLRTRGR